jgi:hypothetical protein
MAKAFKGRTSSKGSALAQENRTKGVKMNKEDTTVYEYCRDCKYHKLAKEHFNTECPYTYHANHDVDIEGCPLKEKS